MKKIHVEQLQTGMIIGKAVYTGDGSMLFTPGTVVESPHLKQMYDVGIKFVEVKDDDTAVRESELTRHEVILTIKGIFKDIALTNPLQQGDVKKTVNEILRRFLRDRCVMLHLTEVRDLDAYVFTHSVNVCMLSLIVGLFLKLKNEQLKNLGLAALLHDVGRSRVPENILYKPSQLSAEEYEKVKRHTVYGHEMLLKTCRQFPQEVVLTALQHHERLDGSGYPNGLCGSEIGLFPRIVAVADVFDALLTDRPFRRALFPHQAVDIIVNSDGQFDPDILKIFVENVAIYPLGSVVALNNGEVGVVVDMNKGRQTRPIVRIVFDSESQKLDFHKEIDLSKFPEMYITKMLREKQVEDMIG